MTLQPTDGDGITSNGVLDERRHSCRDSATDAPAAPGIIFFNDEGTENGGLTATRLYVGRDTAKNAVVNLFDPLGRIRVRLRVDSAGRGSLDFLDDNGRVTFSVPDSVRR